MKIIKQILSSKISPYIVTIIIVFLSLDWISNRPEPKVTRQVGFSSDYMQFLWIKKTYLWNYITDWDSNTLYVVESAGLDDYLAAIDNLTGSTIWMVSLMDRDRQGEPGQFGIDYMFIDNQTIFTVTSTHANAYSLSTGEWLWTTKLGDGHVAIRAQSEDSLVRVYYGEKIIQISKVSGEIITTQPIGNIVWIQNNVEIQCPLMYPQDKRNHSCFIGLTGVDRLTRKILWNNKYAHFSEYYQDEAVKNIAFVGFSENRICALNPETGGYNWCLPTGKISNIAVDEDQKIGYFLRNDFSLVKINLLTGGIVSETKFLPQTLPVEMQQNSYGYIVALTKDTVIASFGDSDQTFGLRINP